MKNLNELNKYRVRGMHGMGDYTCGNFIIPSTTDRKSLYVIASSDMGWDHVSVSRSKRIPNWLEMSQIKNIFFMEDETAFQLHVASEDHINCHNNCLHLWRSWDANPPIPPKFMVGPTKDMDVDQEVSDFLKKRKEANLPIHREDL